MGGYFTGKKMIHILRPLGKYQQKLYGIKNIGVGFARQCSITVALNSRLKSGRAVNPAMAL